MGPTLKEFEFNLGDVTSAVHCSVSTRWNLTPDLSPSHIDSLSDKQTTNKQAKGYSHWAVPGKGLSPVTLDRLWRRGRAALRTPVRRLVARVCMDCRSPGTLRIKLPITPAPFLCPYAARGWFSGLGLCGPSQSFQLHVRLDRKNQRRDDQRSKFHDLEIERGVRTQTP